MMNRPVVEHDVAEAIDLTRMCETFRCLPGPGGLLDQDSYAMFLMKMVIEADNEKAELDSKRRSNP